jgi:hypothetical protein
MKAITKILAGAGAIAALASAAPAAAQYYPGTGYGYPYGGNVVGQVLGQVLGNGYGYGGYGSGYGGNSYGGNSQVAVNQCAAAVQSRLGGGYNGYGYNGYANGAGGRVLGISRVEPRSNGGLTVRGVASSGRYAGAYGYNGQAPVDLTWRCKVDYRGYVSDIDINRAQGAYGTSYGSSPYNGNGYDYSQYGYRRY